MSNKPNDSDVAGVLSSEPVATDADNKTVEEKADTLIKRKPTDSEPDNIDSTVDQSPDEAEGEDDDGTGEVPELSSDEILASLIYDDEDDSIAVESDTSPKIDIFAIGNMIPRIKVVEDIADEPEKTDEQVENTSQQIQDADESEIFPTTLADDGQDRLTEVGQEEITERIAEEDGEPEQIEFDLGAPESDEVTEDVPTEKQEAHVAKKYDPEKPRFIDTVFDYFELLIFTLVAVMVLTSFVFKHSVVDGGSMDKTLTNGEHLIVYSLFYQPKRGDIIVCEDYSTRLKKPIVKRVIALPGEHLVIAEDGTVTVDGTLLDESDYVYINQSDYVYEPIDIVVPDGEVFVMGDHRNISDDSRSDGIGTIDVDAILGKVVLRIYPFDRFGIPD